MGEDVVRQPDLRNLTGLPDEFQRPIVDIQAAEWNAVVYPESGQHPVPEPRRQ